MKTEKIVLSFVAVLIGLLVAGAAFYFYESTKMISPAGKHLAAKTSTSMTPTSAPNATTSLTIDAPGDESVVTSKTLAVKGKAQSNATIEITTPVDDEVTTASSAGDFSTTATLDDGTNQVTVTAISPNGQDETKTITVTYSTENF